MIWLYLIVFVVILILIMCVPWKRSGESIRFFITRYFIYTIYGHNKEQMKCNLIDFHKMMREKGLFFWLSERTALGCIREKGIIDGDTDVDVGCFYTNRARFMQECLPELEKLGFTTMKNRGIYLPLYVSGNT